MPWHRLASQKLHFVPIQVHQRLRLQKCLQAGARLTGAFASSNSRIAIVQANPMPLDILSLMPLVAVADG